MKLEVRVEEDKRDKKWERTMKIREKQKEMPSKDYSRGRLQKNPFTMKITDLDCRQLIR